jgi:antitoxin PrlF
VWEILVATIVQERSRITAKGQTTVPKAVRQALGVSYGGEIAFVVDEHGVSVRRVETEEADPVIGAFLGFLEQDMLRDPQHVVAFPPSLAARMAALAEHVRVDLDEAVDGPVAL